MSSRSEVAERSLLALTPQERVEVIERGIRSLDDVEGASPDEVRSAWESEIARRVEGYASGRAELVDADAHLARLRATLG
jgi:hypothetical protein